MLFLQGTRDEFAERQLLESVVERLAPRPTLKLFEEADHSFHVPARTGRRDPEIRELLLDEVADWIRSMIARQDGKKSTAGSPSRTAIK
jgi:dienelactone hydrolase